jgi:hypothetical protein
MCILHVMMLNWWLGMLQSGIRATGSTLDLYGPRTGVNLGKIHCYIFSCGEIGENGRKS